MALPEPGDDVFLLSVFALLLGDYCLRCRFCLGLRVSSRGDDRQRPVVLDLRLPVRLGQEADNGLPPELPGRRAR